MTTGKSSLDNSVYRRGLYASIFLHLLLAGFVISSPKNTPSMPAILRVTIEAPQRQKASKDTSQQIVSPSETSKKIPPPPVERLKLSDKESSVDKEQIKRGNDGGQPGQSSSSSASPSEAVKNPSAERQSKPTHTAQRKEVTKPSLAPGSQQPHPIKDLKLDDATMSLRFGKAAERKREVREGEAEQQQKLSTYSAFSRPPGSGATFVGTTGINDHLPHLPDGDITLLNAKANQYAGFVRRVAVQVFAQLRSQGWERLSAREINQLGRFSTIEAVLSADGKFLRARILEDSGSLAFDEVVHLSVSNGAQDPNPPPGARASDGLIHFIFKARSWSQIGANRRTGAPVEHRWLLLATGLE